MTTGMRGNMGETNRGYSAELSEKVVGMMKLF